MDVDAVHGGAGVEAHWVHQHILTDSVDNTQLFAEEYQESG
jgi:hypothetical protein